MFLRITKLVGQPVCAALWAVFRFKIGLSAKKIILMAWGEEKASAADRPLRAAPRRDLHKGP